MAIRGKIIIPAVVRNRLHSWTTKIKQKVADVWLYQHVIWGHRRSGRKRQAY